MKGLLLKLGVIWYYFEEKIEVFNKDYLSFFGNLIIFYFIFVLYVCIFD